MTLVYGKLFWAVDEGHGRASGRRVGTRNNAGYRQAMIKGKLYLEHRLIWFYVNGKWPDGILDHINRDKQDNRIENLRESTYELNQRNRTLSKNSTTGYNGVTVLVNGKYKAQIYTNRKMKHIGCYDTIEEAITARKEGERRYWQ